MARHLNTPLRLGIAIGVLSLTLAAGVAAASAGDLQVGAGEMAIHLGRGENGLVIQVASRRCASACGIDLAWRPAARLLPVMT